VTQTMAVADQDLFESTTPERFLLLRELFRRPAGLVGLLVVTALVVLAIAAPVVAPYSYAQQDIPHRMEGPSRAHLLGTDHLGRDLLSRLIYGTRVALGTAFPAVLSAVCMGILIGLVAGYLGGWVDNAVLVVVDTIQAFPAIILALALLAVLGPSLRNVVVVIIIAFTPGYARIARAQVLSLKVNPHIEVERALGARTPRILAVHILPNILPQMFILLAMDMAFGITIEAGLSFLGLGVQPPNPSWGIVLADGFTKIRNSPWPVLWASLAIMIATLGFTVFGETLRDILDPKLAGTRLR